MSSERGNPTRTRPQRHKNTSAFKNNRHDNSTKQKTLNTLTFDDCCERCSQILQWKVQYKKYKPLSQAKKCARCTQLTVKLAYRIVCPTCSEKDSICPKCCQPLSLEAFKPKVVNIQTVADLGPEMLRKLRALPERARRRFERLIEKGKKPIDAANVAVGSDGEVPQTNYWTEQELVLQLESLTMRSQPNFENDDLSDF